MANCNASMALGLCILPPGHDGHHSSGATPGRRKLASTTLTGRLQCEVTPEMEAWVQSVAAANERSVSQQVRYWIKQLMEASIG